MKQSTPDVPWREIAATRDRLIHAYFSVRLDIVWNVVERDLQDLKRRVTEFMSRA